MIIKKVFLKYQICDTNFITTDPGSLAFLDKSKTFYIPNVCDSSIDILKNYNYENLEFDIFFALSHGQHRGELKKGYKDERVSFIDNLDLKKLIVISLESQNNLYGDKIFLMNSQNQKWV